MAKKLDTKKGIGKLFDISEELYAICSNIDDISSLDADQKKWFKASDLSRPLAVKVIWIYIKEQDLQNPDNGREILCDDILKDFFGKKKVTMYEITKSLKPHLIEKN